MELPRLSSTELLACLDSVWEAGNRALAQLLAYLGEVERRRLYVDEACSSMFAFVERRFGLTGGSAYRRLTASRLALRFPSILPLVARGELGLEALCTMKDVLTEANVEELLAATAGKTARQVEHVVACLAPKPDAAASIRKLPSRSLMGGATTREASSAVATADGTSAPLAWSAFAPSAVATRDARATFAQAASAGAPLPTPPRAATRPRFAQLSEERHKVQLTVSSATRAKVERARALMKHRLPSGDLEGLFDQAIDALLEKLEKARLGKTSRPRRRLRPAAAGHVPAAVRREVFGRDGEQCTFVSATGERCGSTELLEIDHAIPRAHGGADATSNLRVVCRAHNRRYAEAIFGAEHVAARIEDGRRRRQGRRPGTVAVRQTCARRHHEPPPA